MGSALYHIAETTVESSAFNTCNDITHSVWGPALRSSTLIINNTIIIILILR